MCTLAVYVRRFAEYPLVVAANRDEFLARPAMSPLLLSPAPRIVGGRDLLAGGTWLGISEHGVAAGLLNRRTADAPVADKRSRGLLMLETLAAPSAADAAQVLAATDPATYNAFTLLVADARTAVVAQNRPDGMQLTELTAGVHVLSNLDFDDPTCPKRARSHERFARVATAFEADGDLDAFRAALRTILSDHTVHGALRHPLLVAGLPRCARDVEPLVRRRPALSCPVLPCPHPDERADCSGVSHTSVTRAGRNG